MNRPFRREIDKAILSDEKLTALQEILSTVGLKDPEHWGFHIAVRDPESYRWGSLEWSERGEGMRYYFYAKPGKPMTKAEVTKLHGESKPRYTKALIAEANRRLSELFES